MAEASAVREPLKRFSKNRLPVHLGHNRFDQHDDRNRSGRQYITPVTLIHSYNDFDFGIRRAHIKTVNIATTSLLLELQRGYYL